MQLASGVQPEDMEVVVSILEQVLLHHDYGFDRSFTGWVFLTDRLSWLAASFHTSARPQMLYERCTSTPGLSLCTTPKQTPMFTTMCTWSFSELRGTCTYPASLSSFGCECVHIISEVNNPSTQLFTRSFFHWLVFWGRSIMRRIFSLLNQVAAALEDSKRLQTQMDTAVETAKQCHEDSQLLKRVSPGRRRRVNLWPPVAINAVYCHPQALLDEEKAMTTNNQQLKLEAEKLRNQVKAADEGEGFVHQWGTVFYLWNIHGAPAPAENVLFSPRQKHWGLMRLYLQLCTSPKLKWRPWRNKPKALPKSMTDCWQNTTNSR